VTARDPRTRHDDSRTTAASRRGPVQVWELEVAKVRLDGRWVRRNREVVRLEDAAEEV
jgi:hypothetical protein